MINYEKMYKMLFNSITNAISELKKSEIITDEVANGIKILVYAQLEAEDYFISKE